MDGIVAAPALPPAPIASGFGSVDSVLHDAQRTATAIEKRTSSVLIES
jgi:hypothetical protein